MERTEQVDASMKHESSDGEDDELDGTNKVSVDSKGDSRLGSDESWCPLFMNGLPSDFSTNPSLAALTSLIDGDDDDSKKIPVAASESRTLLAEPKAGGGKVPKRATRRTAKPYPARKRTEKSSSLGEAQLFLKMWKLSK